MKKEHEVFKVKDKKLPKHEQLVLVKKKGLPPFVASFQVWKGDIFWWVPTMNAIGEYKGRRIDIELSDKWIPLLSKFF